MRVFFGTVALKSPFEKGDLGGFSSAYEIPPERLSDNVILRRQPKNL